MKRSIFVIGLVMTVLSACSGYHLRDSRPLPDAMQKSLYIQESFRQEAGRLNNVVFVLRTNLEEAGATLATSQSNASTILTLTNINSRRIVSGYSGSRQVREFNHTLDVDFSVSGGGLIAPIQDTVHAERSQIYDGNYVLGNAEEEAVIKEELQQEVARLIILRLQALH